MLKKAISCFCYHEIPKIRPLKNALAIFRVGSLPSFYFEWNLNTVIILGKHFKGQFWKNKDVLQEAQRDEVCCRMRKDD